MDKKEWLDRYAKRMIERGLKEKEVEDIMGSVCYVALDLDCFEDDPEQAADDELSLFASDG